LQAQGDPVGEIKTAFDIACEIPDVMCVQSFGCSAFLATVTIAFFDSTSPFFMPS